MVGWFDLAVSESCHELGECEAYGPFLDAGKPVLVAEYDARSVDDPGPVCDESRELGLSTLILPLDLDGSFVIDCANIP